MSTYNRKVSIPIGFSHQLRLSTPWPVEAFEKVSIPIGFSHQLRLPGAGEAAGDLRFQSLSGFLIS